MDEPSAKPQRPNWLDEFEELANEQLGEGNSCEQIHPIVERWFHNLLENEPPLDRPSVEQATACLTTEVYNSLGDEITDKLHEQFSEDEVLMWIEHLLLVGRAFERSLHLGELDDL